MITIKFLLYSDNHWSQYSSIIRKRGEKYSLRLENQIKSINWAMDLAKSKGCWMTFCLGDFFDKAELNSEEVSALEDIRWAGMINNFIVGNHEMGSVNHEYSSARLFSLLDTGCVEIEPSMVELGGIELCILPYILETERKPLSEYFPPRTNLKRVILSHNDIKGMQMGAFISQEGFSKEAIGKGLRCGICEFLEKYKGLTGNEIRQERYERFRSF